MKYYILLFIILLFTANSWSQTSWTGIESTKWDKSGNWTNGKPGKNDDVIIGDANFTGAYQPELKGKSGKCKNLFIGDNTKVSVLTLSANIDVTGDITIGSNGSILQLLKKRNIKLSGNWMNNGAYSCTGDDAGVIFSGNTQSINGPTEFKNLEINYGSTVTLNDNISISDEIVVTGIFKPTNAYFISGTGDLVVKSRGEIIVETEMFSESYNTTGSISLDKNSTVEYASSIITQNISSDLTYGTLSISGGTTKYLTANLPPLYSSSNKGKIQINDGILDLKTFTANRGAGSGGSFIIADGCSLLIGGTNGFPENFNSVQLANTSTVSYYGNNQTVLDENYGNLKFSSTSGSVVKTLPSSNLKILGDFTSEAGIGTGVTFTASGKIYFYGKVSLDASSTFNLATHNINFYSNIENNGIVNGNSSIVYFQGVNTNIEGSGTINFHTVYFRKPGITATASTIINVSGKLYTTNGGSFTHANGGSLSMTGTDKLISGNLINLSDFNVSGTIKGYSNTIVSGDFVVDGTFESANSSHSFTMDGTDKTISGTGSITLYSLGIEGSVTTARDITIERILNVDPAATFSATNGNIIFDGWCLFSGEADVFDLTINSSKTLRLGNNTKLGIANTFTKTGNLNVVMNTPNTIIYNSSGNQNIVTATYHNLIVENGATKTTLGALAINHDLTINSSTTLSASDHTHTIKRNFINEGAFVCNASTIQFTGDFSSRIVGESTFNDIIINKTHATAWANLRNNIEVNDLYMTNGSINTDTSSITITNSRNGAGLILGTITRNHSFTTATPYYFEGLNNYLTFTSPSVSLNSVTVQVDAGLVHEYGGEQECVDREYTITIPSGTYSDASFSFHYEEYEVNAFVEPVLALYRYNSGTTSWDSIGATTRNATDNYVMKSGITDVTSSWILSGLRNIVRWDGSDDTDWDNATNWTTISGTNMGNRVPNSDDVAQIGFAAFTNAPEVSSTETIGALRFGDGQESTLTINGGTLNVLGGMRGRWSSNAHHTLNVSSGTLNVGTDICLSDDIAQHYISLNIGTGTVISGFDFDDDTFGEITFTGAGELQVGKNFNFENGDFTAGSGTVVYNGGGPQTVAAVTYNNLTFNKSDECAEINSNTTVNGNITINTGGHVEVNDTLIVAGNISIGANTELHEEGTLIKLAGNWQNNGVFTPTTGTVCFNGSSDQVLNPSTFNILKIDKSSGTLSTSGDLLINNSLNLQNGSFDISTYHANRVSYGGLLELGSGSSLKISGDDNFPEKYSNVSINASSTVEYYGSGTQWIDSIEYGNLIFSNGGANVKTLTGSIVAKGNLTINSGATIEPDSNTVTAYGNFTNNGTFNPSTSTLILDGTSKVLAGNATFNNLYVLTGSYTVSSTAVDLSGDLLVDDAGTLDFADAIITLDGDLTNKGSLLSSGTANFSGIREQTIQLLNSISSTSTGIINFNGTIEPVISSTSSPNFATVNINNTAGITPSVPWNVFVAFNIPIGSSFNAGALTHTFYGDFTNEGTFTSDGLIKYNPIAPYSSSATITLDGTGFTSTGTIEFGGSVPITIVDNSPNYNDISITNTNAAGVTFPNGIYVPGNLFIEQDATMKGGAGLTYTISGSLTNNGTIDGETSTMVFNGAPSVVKGVGACNYNNLTIDVGSELQLHKLINVSGNFTNNETFTPLGRTVSFNGSTPSVIGGLTSPAIFDDIEMNKSSNSTTLNVPVVINSSLTLTDGILNSSSTNLLTIADDATSSSGTATSFVSGPVKKVGDDAFVFPLGDNSVWASIGISAPGLPTDEFTAEYTDDAYSNIEDVSDPINNVSEVEHWILDRTTGSSNVAVTLFWEGGSRSSINDLSDLRVVRFDGSNWTNETQDGGTTGDVSLGTITSQSIVSFSPFTFGSLSAGLNPLPVEWLDFSVSNEDGLVRLGWKTAAEKDNDYFTVLRSKDGKQFVEAQRIKGAGNSSEIQEYATIDKEPYEGINYYKIKQTDFDGKYKYSDVLSIFVSSTSLSEFQIYPNPTSLKGEVTIQLGYVDSESITVEIFTAAGAEVFKSNYEVSSLIGKAISLPIKQTGIDLPGQYFVVVTGSTQIDKKILIVK